MIFDYHSSTVYLGSILGIVYIDPPLVVVRTSILSVPMRWPVDHREIGQDRVIPMANEHDQQYRAAVENN